MKNENIIEEVKVDEIIGIDGQPLPEKKKAKGAGAFWLLGMSMGMLLGALFGNIGLGFFIGWLTGFAVDEFLRERNNKENN